MPKRPLKPCSAPGCPNLAPPGQKYCPAHQHLAKQQWNRGYDVERGNSAQRGYGARWRRLRAWFLKRHPLCQAEGCRRPAEHVDHIIPKRAGGTDHTDNLQALCASCHSRKTLQEKKQYPTKKKRSSIR